MPSRTKEQLQQIYEDLVAVREVVNQLHDLGELWPTPMNGKTWEEEKNEWYFAGINGITDLIGAGKVKSCEVISVCEDWVSNVENQRNQSGFWNHYGKQYRSSSEEDVLGDANISMDKMIEELELAIQGKLAENRMKQLNEAVDSFGSSACGPRAMMENPGKSDWVERNSSLPKANSVNCHFRA